ncbi:hypothetical protein Q9X98_004895 [Vibrio parahaemolyticus]|nr:hypothetical protein [Vibrio parahaemolyticus]
MPHSKQNCSELNRALLNVPRHMLYQYCREHGIYNGVCRNSGEPQKTPVINK